MYWVQDRSMGAALSGATRTLWAWLRAFGSDVSRPAGRHAAQQVAPVSC